jgi:CheY-like chemotaxis protein
MMGGDLHVESALSIGSKFSFTLPFDTVGADSAQINDKDLIEKPLFSGEVLVCEDNSMNQDVITSHLLQIGLEPTLAENGKQGLELAEERMKAGHPFDLILMDIQMPVMDGFDAAKKLIEIGVKTPIIAMTANVIKEDNEKYLGVGMADCLTKPFKQQKLWTCLLKFLKPVMPFDALEHEDEKKWNGGEVIDRAIGIENSAGDEALYGKMLMRFLEKQRQAHDQLEKAIAEKDYSLARAIAHKETGSAAIIGAVKLSAILSELEKAFKTEEPGSQGGMMEDYGKELDAVLNCIAREK